MDPSETTMTSLTCGQARAARTTPEIVADSLYAGMTQETLTMAYVRRRAGPGSPADCIFSEPRVVPAALSGRLRCAPG